VGGVPCALVQSLNFLRVTSQVTTKLEYEVAYVGFQCSSATVTSGLVLSARWVSHILRKIQKVVCVATEFITANEYANGICIL